MFDTISFFLFLLAAVFLYFLIPQRFRWAYLLAASSIFYASFVPWYLLVLFFLVAVDYICAIEIERGQGRWRKFWLFISIFSTCGALFIFKYFNFFTLNTAALAHLIGWNYSPKLLSLMLPIGLSFHTFQSLSYVIEVYRKNYPAERHLGIYALYVMFFPQLIAGPIEKPQHLLPQFRQAHTFDQTRVANGLKRMALGLFKKIVIADRLAWTVNEVFASTQYHGLSLAVAVIFFAFQIYYDFSGYCDIALGAAQIMGFTLVENFDRPYLSKNIAEFWTRWHMSLFNWFKEYIYIPLGGNRKGKLRQAINIMIVFFVSGLWHGANWTFIVWGLLHGAFWLIGRFTKSLRQHIARVTRLASLPRLHSALQISITFLLVSFAWIFFRAQSLGEALSIIKNMASGFMPDVIALAHIDKSSFPYGIGTMVLGKSVYEMAITLGCLIFMIALYFFQRKYSDKNILAGERWPVRWAFYYSLIFGLIFFSVFAKINFIYFQF